MRISIRRGNTMHKIIFIKTLKNTPAFKVAPQCLIKSCLDIPTCFMNLVMCSVVLSPTPMIPDFLDLITTICFVTNVFLT